MPPVPFRTHLLAAALASAIASPVFAQNVITTTAGADWLFPTGERRAIDAPLGGSPTTGLFVAAEPQGAIYIADPDNLMVFRVSTDGVLRPVAGNGVAAHSGDGGPAISAAIGPPTAIAADGKGGFFVAFADRIRRVDANGIITTVSSQSPFSGIAGIAVDSADNLIIGDKGNRRIARLSPSGAVATVASGLSGPGAVGTDRNGNVYFIDQPADGPGQLRVVNVTGRVSTVNASLADAAGLAIEPGGAVYVSDPARSSVYRVSADASLVTLVAGLGQVGGSGLSGDGGAATSARLDFSSGSLATDNLGNLYIGDNGNGRVRRVASNGVISTAAGNGAFRYSGDGGPAAAAALYQPSGIAIDSTGALYVAEPRRNRVRRIAANGTVSVFAGTGQSGVAGDGGPADRATLWEPSAVAVDSRGAVYIADTRNSRIRAVSADGRIQSPYIDGLNRPEGIAVDAAGNLYIADTENHRVRRFAADGTLTLLAGNGTRGFSGEGTPAVSAALNRPTGIAVNAAGTVVWFADSGNGRVRRIQGGVIATVAEGLNGAAGVALAGDGAVYVSESGGQRVRRIDANGASRVVAGTGSAGYSGDGGPADRATLFGPAGLAFDSVGALHIADRFNHRIRKVLAAPPALASSPASLSFSVVPDGDDPGGKSFFVTSAVPGVPFTASGNRPWLSLTPSSGLTPAAIEVRVDPRRLGDDTSDATVSIAAPLANPSQRTVAVHLDLATRGERGLRIESTALSYSLFEGGQSAPQSVTLVNPLGSPIEFRARAISIGWLRVSPESGQVPPVGSVNLEVVADPVALSAGTYTGRVAVTEAAENEETVLPVTATVSAAPQSIALTATGVTFTAVAGGAVTPPQTVGVVNLGRGTMQWTAAASGLATSAGWLSVSPDRGSSAANSGSVPEFAISVNASGLAPGDYYGQVQVSAPDADNSPQIVLAVLTVLPSGSTPTPIPLPSTLVFNAAAGAGSPGGQTVTVSNLTNRLFTYTSGRLAQSGAPFFTHLPAAGALGGGQSSRIVVQPLSDGLAPGIYRGALTLLFDNGTPRVINLVLIVGGAGGPQPRKPGAREAGECAPSALVPVFTSLASEVAIPAGWPQRLVVRVLDNCGAPQTTGAVSAQFSGGIPPLNLTSLKDGNWAGTWQVRDNSTSVTIKVKAEQPDRQLRGAAEITGTIRANENPPLLDVVPILNAASLAPQAPLAPGMLVTILGSRLAQAPAAASSFPLPAQLAGTLVAMGGHALPLVEVAEDRIGAIVPFDVPVNTRVQMVVQRAGAAAAPETVTLAPAQPAIFTRDKSGSGQGLISRVNPDGSLSLADASNPAAAGDTIVLQSTGLGVVDPAIPSGAAGPDAPPARTLAEATLTIGGVEVKVESAVLQPGTAGIYLVSATVPEGAPVGDAVEVVLTASRRSSPPVTMALR